jgi:Zn-dependent protease
VVLHAFGGLAMYEGRRHRPIKQILISAAGPGAGFALAAGAIVALRAGGFKIPNVLPFWPEAWADVWNPGGNRIPSDLAFLLVSLLLYVNIWWGLVNMLPVFPLDGGQIFRELMEIVMPGRGWQVALQVSIVTGIGVAVYAATHREPYVAVLFGYLAFLSYQSLQAYTGRGFGRPW